MIFQPDGFDEHVHTLRVPDAWIDLEAAVEAIHRAESAVAQQDWARAWGPVLVALFVAERGFLPGEDADWIDQTGNQLAEVRLRALECYAAAELGIGGAELAGALRAARRHVALDLLRDQLGVSPGPRTRALYQQLLGRT
ncbi:hypothetical protein ACSVHC_19940 [Arthrobacter sp. KNU-44]|uniref:hypothetical protein n=1 Tax=unclassified Arthrobacter TaxID=235627 RepID=UPI003F445247